MRRMIPAFVVMSLVFVAAYAYVFLRLVAPFPALVVVGWVMVVAGPALHIGSFAAQVSGRHGRVHDVVSLVAYGLMGFFAFLFVLSVGRDVLLLLLAAVLPEPAPGPWSPLAVANVVVVALAALAVVVGFFEARRVPRVRRVDVPIADLDPALHGFTIAQLTDVHIGPTIKGRFLRRVVDAVNALSVDAVVITGDLIDGTVERLADDVRPLEKLAARHGTYYVTGNHEYYSGAGPWVRFVESLGVRALLNRHVVLDHDGAPLVMSGVPDETAGLFLPEHACAPDRALEGAPDAPTVLLAHQPRTVRRISDDTRVDLMLAGHTHGGQFWPWSLLVPLQQPYVQGLVKHARTWVYTSRGTGYWGPPLRLFAPSEISLVRLVAG